MVWKRQLIALSVYAVSQTYSINSTTCLKVVHASFFSHTAANCELLCSLETVRLLLALLQNEPLDTSAQVTVVMCLGMLTEDSRMLNLTCVSTQRHIPIMNVDYQWLVIQWGSNYLWLFSAATSQKVFKDSDGLNIMLKCLVHSKVCCICTFAWYRLTNQWKNSNDLAT